MDASPAGDGAAVAPPPSSMSEKMSDSQPKAAGSVRFQVGDGQPRRNTNDGSRPSANSNSGKQSMVSGRRSRSRGRSRSRRSSEAGPPPASAPAGEATSLGARQTQRSWVSVAKISEKGYGLSFFPPTLVDDKPIVKIPAEVLREANPKWAECLVGYFVGKRLPFKLTADAVRNSWGECLVDVMANEEGFFFFHIPDESQRQRILEAGPVTIARVPLVLQQWRADLELKREVFDKMPVWVRLKSIPYALWSPTGVGYVASALGQPLHVDLHTEKLSRISFARVCVAISASQTVLQSVNVECDGKSWVVDVEYEGKLMVCAGCGKFGHKCAPKASPPAEGLRETAPAPAAAPPAPAAKENVPRTAEAPGTSQATTEWTVVSRRKERPVQKPPVPPAVVLSLTDNAMAAMLDTPAAGLVTPSEIQNPLFVNDGDSFSSPDDSNFSGENEADLSSEAMSESSTSSSDHAQNRRKAGASRQSKRLLGPCGSKFGGGLSPVKPRQPPRRGGSRKR